MHSYKVSQLFGAARRLRRPPQARSVRNRNFTRFHQLLEAMEILRDLLRRLLAEDPGDPAAERAGRRRVLELDADLGAARAGCSREAYGPAVLDGGAFERSPRNPFVL